MNFKVTYTAYEGQVSILQARFLGSWNDGSYTIYFNKISEVEVPEHVCESVCFECGLCTEVACAEEACVNKCEDHAKELALMAPSESDSYYDNTMNDATYIGYGILRFVKKIL